MSTGYGRMVPEALAAVLVWLVVVGPWGCGGKDQDQVTTTSTPRGSGANHLAGEKSPYLKQHAHNPVDWYPWGPEAFARARTEDKPIFLSIGYSTCHWCHVMAHESFENDSIAALMNRLFVNIKVDREERPDVDALYMRAVQAMTREGGGWPLSVFLTPDLVPFFGGTYFPPEDRYGRPGFPTVLQQIADAYRTHRSEIDSMGAQIAEFLRAGPAAGADVPPESLLDVAYRQYAADFDTTWGGFGSAPKFSRSMSLSFLLRYHLRHPQPDVLAMVTRTLDAMTAGGIHDHLGGGFHRYATDERWLVPHFEKMLYDHALLARAYLEAYQATGDARYAAVAREIFAYLERDMRAPEGGFYSAEDADSEGEEGRFYIWSRAEIDRLLGEDAALFTAAYDVSEGGNFEGQNILWTPRPVAEIARAFGLPPEEAEVRLAGCRGRLLQARDARVRPHRDEKILTSWNALALGAFALGYQVLGDSFYLEVARGIERFLTARMWDGRTLKARWAEGETRFDGCLDDYAFFAWALTDLYESTFDPACLRLAFAVMDRAEVQFATSDGGYFLSPAARDELIARPQEVYDGALPSGNSVMVLNLLKRGEYTGDVACRARAERALRAYKSEIEQHPSSFPQMLSALDFLYAGPREVVIAGTRRQASGFIEALRRLFAPSKVVLLAAPDEAGLADLTPLIRDKEPGPGHALAYVCRNFTCRLPTADPAEMLTLLR